MTAITAHVRYAFHPRQGARSRGGYHAILDGPLNVGRLHRVAGDALCKPRGRFWGLYEGNPSPVDCVRCVALMERHGVVAREEGAR